MTFQIIIKNICLENKVYNIHYSTEFILRLKTEN